jgi:hypothetical protein
MISILFAIQVAATVPDAASEQERRMGAYMTCIRKAAVRIEPAGESPDDTSTAAALLCSAEYDAVLGAGGYRGLTPNQIDDAGHQAALQEVVFTRLCKKTGDCAFAQFVPHAIPTARK